MSSCIGIMANASGNQIFPPQAATLPRPALVAYSDSDSESLISDTTEQAEANRLDAAQVMVALSLTKITSSDGPFIERPTSIADVRKQVETRIMKGDKIIAKGSHGHNQEEHPEINVDDDDETILDINNATHDIEFETTLADDNEAADWSTNTPRCWGDIKYPRIGTCDHEFKIINRGERYRKVVSDFFGRNKKATASVPPDCYPTICRTCYQRLAYRLGSMNKDDPEKDAAAVAKLRCDAIIAALEKMKEKTFGDRNGYEWPWWCGLELQLTNDGQKWLDNPEELEAEIEKKNGEVAQQKANKAKSPKGTSFKRLHKRFKPEYLPDWLQKLCQANTDNVATNDVATSTIGDRNGVRYSFDELILIIKAIKTFCHESRCAFPTIQAIPVPIGLLDEQVLKEKRKLRAAANKLKTETKKAAADAERDARDQPSNTLRKKKATSKRKTANDALAEADTAERAMDCAQEDALLSAETIPGKRRKSDATSGKAGKVRIDLKKMKAEKVLESPPKTSKDDDGEVSDEDVGQDDDADDGDFEDDASTLKQPPAKRARTSSKPKPKPKAEPKRKTYQMWIKKKYGNNPPPPVANIAELRHRFSQAVRDGYGPVKPVSVDPVEESEDESED